MTLGALASRAFAGLRTNYKRVASELPMVKRGILRPSYVCSFASGQIAEALALVGYPRHGASALVTEENPHDDDWDYLRHHRGARRCV